MKAECKKVIKMEAMMRIEKKIERAYDRTPDGKLLYGGDYNPDQWLDRPDILKEDIALMKEAHVNCVFGRYFFLDGTRTRGWCLSHGLAAKCD